MTATVTAANKVYDGTTAATSTCTLAGIVGGEVVTCAGTAAFDTALVGTGKTVTVTGIALGGDAAANYTLSSTTATTTATITGIQLTPTVTVANKSYDGTTAVALTSCTVSTAIVVSWDPNPPSEGVLGYLLSIGTEPGVYTVTLDVGKQTTFAYAPVSPGQHYYFAVTAYNAGGTGPTAEVTGVVQASGVVTGDGVGCTGSATFDTTSVGLGKTVTVTGLTLDGAGSGQLHAGVDQHDHHRGHHPGDS